MGNPNLISLGAGILRTADPGSQEPTDLLTAWSAAWSQVGYTHAGSQFGHTYATEPVEVAEELDPLFVDVTGRVATLKFIAAEDTATQLKRLLNGGTITFNAAGDALYDPPEINELTRRMYGWESRDAQVRGIFRQCFAGGAAEINHAKGGANKVGLPFELTLEKPTGLKPFRFIYAAARA
jgi:hypothetical protein